jgi:hypothetical protein
MLALVKQVRVLLREKECWKPTNGKISHYNINMFSKALPQKKMAWNNTT